jgi:transcriptional regulator with XRE-family HTH domain
MRDLDGGSSPLHHFGAEVRRARTAAGMTLADLAARVPCDASTVSRAESGHLAPTERFAAACDEAFPHMDGWFTRFYADSRKWDGPYPRWFIDYVVAEREALSLRMWGVELVPGLLQTPEYARELFRAWQPSATDDGIDELVNGRMERQRILDRANPPEVWVVLDESVLHRQIGSAKIMHGQLEHLSKDAYTTPSITIQIVPASIGAHAGLLGAFAIASGDGSPDTLYLDTTVQGQTVVETALVRKAASIFDRLRAEALPRGASRDLIEKVAEELWKI